MKKGKKLARNSMNLLLKKTIRRKTIMGFGH